MTKGTAVKENKDGLTTIKKITKTEDIFIFYLPYKCEKRNYDHETRYIPNFKSIIWILKLSPQFIKIE